jgi:hypothetical protein
MATPNTRKPPTFPRSDLDFWPSRPDPAKSSSQLPNLDSMPALHQALGGRIGPWLPSKEREHNKFSIQAETSTTRKRVVSAGTTRLRVVLKWDRKVIALPFLNTKTLPLEWVSCPVPLIRRTGIPACRVTVKRRARVPVLQAFRYLLDRGLCPLRHSLELRLEFRMSNLDQHR